MTVGLMVKTHCFLFCADCGFMIQIRGHVRGSQAQILQSNRQDNPLCTTSVDVARIADESRYCGFFFFFFCFYSFPG